eukprot:3764799-Prymnesium_polylepis.1
MTTGVDNDEKLWSQDLISNGTRQLVASTAGQIPGAAAGSQTFSGFTDASGGSSGRITFLGEGAGSWPSHDLFMGLYAVDQPGATVQKLVDVHDPLPPTLLSHSSACAPTFA